MSLYEYVWVDGTGGLRSKLRLLSGKSANIPNWSYDGSSTGQATGENSEILLKPKAVFKSKTNIKLTVLVLCGTYDMNGKPTPSNTRDGAKALFDKNRSCEPWFGLEQEYFILDPNTGEPCGSRDAKEQGQYYCGVGTGNVFGRQLVIDHMIECIDYGITVSGINAEVAPGQWEFQIGPCIGIAAGDHLWMARFLLYRMSEEHNMKISLDPKPLKGAWNGSGCHANYSTKNMREGTNEQDGLYYIHAAIDKLSKKHTEHMKVYGANNEERMTGESETSSYTTFTNGIANRGASVRIGHETIQNKKGYFEDRRPASNCDPYLVTSAIFETTML